MEGSHCPVPTVQGEPGDETSKHPSIVRLLLSPPGKITTDSIRNIWRGGSGTKKSLKSI